ncbi:MAG TPA: acyl-CoA dehydrogenase family protein [Vicinamibacterales bacterium]|nr:acyl-CoA dehydrogenase family protein [Vicinamibacterales bacterium]
MNAPVSTPSRRGGAWLLDAVEPESIFTPEQLSEEQRLIARTADEFVQQEVLPQLERLEKKEWAVARSLIARCGELGLLGVDVPEMYGGVGLDKVTSLLVSERIAACASFAATFGAQANLTVLPMVLFGTEAQKQRYLPRLLSGELVGAYALSEPGSGSDALGAKARATRQPDGSYVLSGEKMWITNGGFADLFIVFAKVDGEQFTAFIVERAFAGVSNGKEEHKMGLFGSSTTPLILQDVRVPAENLLGEVGKGHKVAFNVLNFGRFKLGAMCSGGARTAIGEAAKYAAQRKQFGQPIAAFGAIKYKLAEMTVRQFAIESSIYRTAGLIDAVLAATSHDPDDSAPVLAAVEEYAVEASIAKVAGSEMLDYVLDENVQIHGGNGFVADYPAEGHYRDARVNRIFEGTNEINRMLIPGMLVRRAVKGDLPLIAAAKKLQEEILEPPAAPAPGTGGPLDEERRAVAAFKKVALMALGLAMQRYGQGLTDQQEVLMYIADILMDVYGAESAVLRALDSSRRQVASAGRQVDAARIFVNDAAARIDASAKCALAAMADGDTLRTQLAALRRLLKVTPIDTVSLRRRIAEETTARGGYIFAER